MALQKKVLLATVTVASLLCVYVLRLNLERPRSWSIGSLGLSSENSEQPPPPPPDPEGKTEQPNQPPSTSHLSRAAQSGALSPTAAATAKQAQKDVPDVSQPKPNGQAKSLTVRPPKAPRPTESSFIGDFYMSGDIPPQTDCKDSIRRQVGGTVFGERFLERIPVLQWAKHVTSAEHQRLRQYPGAHGWGGIDYKTLFESLSVLNSSANWQMLDDWSSRSNESECTRCAVVGNGGILKDSKKGKEIDAHHYVFRTNGAITKGFEQDVGSRTTHYTFSTNTLMNSMRSYSSAGYKGPPVSKETRYIFLPDHDRDYLLVKAAATHKAVERGPEKGKSPSMYFGEDVSAEKLKMYHPDFIRYLRNRFLRSHAMNTKYRDIYRPSTGATMLLAALHTCDQVDAYGFMTPDYAQYSDHYYDNTYHPVGFYINHDLRMEMSLWQQLHQAGLIRLYMHQ